jgi:hypothetical protein
VSTARHWRKPAKTEAAGISPSTPTSKSIVADWISDHFEPSLLSLEEDG